MTNLTMQRKLETGEAIDLSDKPKTPEGWILLDAPLKMGQDYCLADTEEWVWWCKRLKDGRIVAGTNPREVPPFAIQEAIIWLR